jgi:hypothetical protein
VTSSPSTGVGCGIVILVGVLVLTTPVVSVGVPLLLITERKLLGLSSLPVTEKVRGFNTVVGTPLLLNVTFTVGITGVGELIREVDGILSVVVTFTVGMIG